VLRGEASVAHAHIVKCSQAQCMQNLISDKLYLCAFGCIFLCLYIVNEVVYLHLLRICVC